MQPRLRFSSFMMAFLIVGSSLGQRQSKADSLRPIYLQDTTRGLAKMELLRELAFNEITDPDLALFYANELITLARELGNNRYLYRGYLQKGNSRINQGNLAVVLDAYQSALDAAKKDGYKVGEGTALTALGFTYASSGEPDRAAEFFDRSIAIFRDSAQLTKPGGPVGLGLTLYNIGDFYLNQGELDKAEQLLTEAGQIFEENNYRAGLNYVHGDQGILYAKRGDFNKAEIHMREAIRELEEDEDLAAIAAFQTSLAEVYREMGEYIRAHAWAGQGLEHALHLGLKDQISESSLVMAELDSLTGDFKEAYSHLSLHMRYKDSMDSETVDMTRFERQQAELANAELELEQVRMENELEMQSLQQKRQRAALWAIGATALLLIAFTLGGYRRYRYIRKTNKIISEERDRSEGLLLNILPKETAEELKTKGRVRAQRFDAVTVLFTDFKDFTQHAESMDPEKLVESIDFYFSHFDSIMDKYGLEKIKTVGDAYMCASGLPFPVKDHAERVVEAAIEMLDFVKAAKADPSEEHIRFDVRIGINSGPVVAGVVGTKKFAYDIWGDTVNIASRMESASEPGKINIAEGTYALVKGSFDCEYRGNIAVKNRGELEMYFVKGPRPRTGEPSAKKRIQDQHTT